MARAKRGTAPKKEKDHRRGRRTTDFLIPEVTDRELDWFYKTFGEETAKIGAAIVADLTNLKPDGITRARRGRPTTLDVNQIARICVQLRNMIPLADACHIEGLPVETMYVWLKKGEKDPEKYPQFEALRRVVQRSLALCKGTAVARIRQAGNENPEHLKWMLTRRFPKEWGSAPAEADAADMPVAQIPGVTRMLEILAAGIPEIQREHPGAAAALMTLLSKALAAATQAEAGAAPAAALAGQ